MEDLFKGYLLGLGEKDVSLQVSGDSCSPFLGLPIY
jgi:hypothetical protein